METKAYSFTHRTKVFADGTVRKNSAWTSGELAWFSVGTEISDPISESEMGSDAGRVVGLPSIT